MAFSMRALKTFVGRPGESRRPDNLVEMGVDFNAADQRRFDYLERKEFAAPLIMPRAKAEPAHANKMEPPLRNKAASDGPLPSTGGATGETSALASSSAQAPAPVKRGSRRGAEKLDI